MNSLPLLTWMRSGVRPAHALICRTAAATFGALDRLIGVDGEAAPSRIIDYS